MPALGPAASLPLTSLTGATPQPVNLEEGVEEQADPQKGSTSTANDQDILLTCLLETMAQVDADLKAAGLYQDKRTYIERYPPPSTYRPRGWSPPGGMDLRLQVVREVHHRALQRLPGDQPVVPWVGLRAKKN